jgi:GT2 family glycosyltransferase
MDISAKAKTISVVVITRNEEKNIRDCLDSLNSQNYDRDKYEMVVVDSSTDKTPSIVRSYSSIKLFIMPDAGFAKARNKGVQEATSEHVAFIDADCIAPRNWLSNLANYLDEGFAGLGGHAFPPENSSHIGYCIACLGFPAGGVLGLSPNDLPVTCNAIFKRAVLQMVGGFDTRLRHGGEDADLCRRLKENGFKLKIVQSSFVYHKTRSFREFVAWSYRRGIARYELHRSAIHLFYPVTAFAYPFSKKFRLLAKNRRKLKLGIFSLLLIIPVLFFIRQTLASVGWIYGAIRGIEK